MTRAHALSRIHRHAHALEIIDKNNRVYCAKDCASMCVCASDTRVVVAVEAGM